MPIMVQSKLKEPKDDHMVTAVYTISNNVDLLCRLAGFRKVQVLFLVSQHGPSSITTK